MAASAGGGTRSPVYCANALGGGKMLFVWTPQRVRIAVYFIAAYIALC